MRRVEDLKSRLHVLYLSQTQNGPREIGHGHHHAWFAKEETRSRLRVSDSRHIECLAPELDVLVVILQMRFLIHIDQLPH